MKRTRFDQAKSFVNESKQRFGLLCAEVPKVFTFNSLTPEFSVSVANIFSNLRMSLDRCAEELYVQFVLPLKPSKVYKTFFPISPQGKQCDVNDKWTFEKWVNDKMIRGLDDARSDIVGALRSYQEFTDPANNGWFPIFGKISNTNKHSVDDPTSGTAELHVNVGNAMGFSFPSGNEGRSRVFIDGVRLENCGGQSGTINFMEISGTEIFGDMDGDLTVRLMYELISQFDSCPENVMPFIDKSISGVDKIVNQVSSLK